MWHKLFSKDLSCSRVRCHLEWPHMTVVPCEVKPFSFHCTWEQEAYHNSTVGDIVSRHWSLLEENIIKYTVTKSTEKRSKDVRVKGEPIYIDPRLQDGTTPTFVNLPLLDFEAKFPAARISGWWGSVEATAPRWPVGFFSRIASTTRGIHAAGNQMKSESTQLLIPTILSKLASESFLLPCLCSAAPS